MLILVKKSISLKIIGLFSLLIQYNKYPMKLNKIIHYTQIPTMFHLNFYLNLNFIDNTSIKF